jgi:WD40 repeat protein
MEPLSRSERVGRVYSTSVPTPSLPSLTVSPKSNQKAVIYNLSLSPSLTNSPIEHTLNAHTRAVTDINWSPGSSEMLATCGLDGWIYTWDLRTGYGSRSGTGGGRKPVGGFCGWNCEFEESILERGT